MILDSTNLKIKSPEEGFYIRLKPRDVYFGIALHEGDGDSESEGEPLITVTDRDGPLGTPALYGFALVTGKGNGVGSKKIPSVVQVFDIFEQGSQTESDSRVA